MALFGLILTAIILQSFGAFLMSKRFLIFAVALAACVPLGGCQSFSLADYADFANELDPDCGKRVHVKVVPMVFPWGVFPMVSEASYDKACKLEQFEVQPVRVPLGSVVIPAR